MTKNDSKECPLAPHDTFTERHIGPRPHEVESMLKALSLGSLDELVDAVVPSSLRLGRELAIGDGAAGQARGEDEVLRELREISELNECHRALIGMGYHGCIVPGVVMRNVFENPGWYTQYTAYQAEVSQGRLEALMNFQTMVSDLCGLPLAGASLLDEATAAAEAMTLCYAAKKRRRQCFVASPDTHPQTLAVLRTRAEPLGIELRVQDPSELEDAEFEGVFGVLVSYPDTYGRLRDLEPLCERVHAADALVVVATDLLALTLLRPPGEFGADVAVGSSQRFGVPLGYGGPHAAFIATEESYRRLLPGRIIGLSKDVHGEPALRMALQTREQHIRRDKATSNICTAQVLLAVMSAMYAVYHGPEGLTRIARKVRRATAALAAGLVRLGHDVGKEPYFDTLRVKLGGRRAAADVLAAARARGILLRPIDGQHVGLSLDERVDTTLLTDLLEIFGADSDPASVSVPVLLGDAAEDYSGDGAEYLQRTSTFLTNPVFHSHRSEHDMLRYLKRLEERDISLTTSMIPLGSCTMKLNGTTEMIPVSWPGFSDIHPFAPADTTRGYAEFTRRMEEALCEITGFAAFSLQPNAGSQGEYAGMLVIRAYHRSRGDEDRDVCLIPVSAHGTNPASAVLAGTRVVTVACDDRGNVDVDDLERKAEQHADQLAALMVTYPSTHGVFEERIEDICRIVHEHGGQVYLDGANLNAQVGLCRPGDFGADVCHLNLHKTFSIPHGGGGPGMGPIGVAAHLAPFLPSHPLSEAWGGTDAYSSEWDDVGGEHAIGPVSAAPFGSASILPISGLYITLLGARGLRRSTEVAILAANYMRVRLEPHYEVLFVGERGYVGHEFIIDFRPFEKSANVHVEDVAKRLMDYGFHSPTMSFPVVGTLMIEPTESESLPELERYCEALISIREEIRELEQGRADREDNLLSNAPHTARHVTADEWKHPYSRERAAFPAPWVREHKFWPAVGRVDNGYGDKHLVCTCPPIEAYEEGEALSEDARDGALGAQSTVTLSAKNP